MRAGKANCIAVLLLTSTMCFAASPAVKPKLVVAVIVDQFRYDYLTRFQGDYHGGLHQMMTQGADFTNAFYEQIPTVTAVGHSIFLSGAMPAVSGIINNAWYDRDEKKMVTSVCDWSVHTVGGHQETEGAKCTDSDPASPKRYLVSTVGDELRAVNEASKVIGVSIKARGAILPSGHRAAGAYWFDNVSGNFVTSSFYRDQLPEWADAFNGRKLPAQYVERKWDGFEKWEFRGTGKEPYAKLPASPWGNELIEAFAEQAVVGEKLGQRGATDLLTVSFSSNDYVGHQVGPDSPEVHNMAIRTDQLLGKLFALLNQKVGMSNVLVVLSADHGVSTVPERAMTDKMPGGRLTGKVEDVVQSALSRKFGEQTWLMPGVGQDGSFYFNQEALAKSKAADWRSIYETTIEAILANPQLHVARVYSREQMAAGIPGDFIARAAMNGFYPRRSGDLQLIFEPGYVSGGSGTTHFSPYAYDRHVPVLFLGPGIVAGHYNGTIAVNDIAPTLATILEIQTPSGSSGRVLTEMLAH